MKRFNLVLDQDLVKRVMQITGERTYSGAVTKALKEMDRLETLRRGIEEMQGSGWWEGDLEAMRENRLPGERPRRRSAKVARVTTRKRATR